ncbi:branched-chain amino acid ABC transporter permease [Aurantimonas sp. A2-1-M11]|uniref:branched-chain amino acid ABC transporter permease n=1 Tax=Aurantimonas sp. A2-1-M11 TaxID=3113712 RepID=UPI002F92A2E6
MSAGDVTLAGNTPDVAPERRPSRLDGRGTALAAALIFAVLALLPLLATAVGDQFLLVTATRIMIFALATLSLDLILGYGAMVSFGHAAFIGLGAYSVAILAAHGVNDILVQAGVAILICSLFALVTGAISLRTKGVYFIMITLAFGQMAYFFMVSLSAYGGDDGITLATRSTLFGLPVLRDNLAFFYVVLATLALTFVALRAVVGSRFGRVLRGTRDNRVRMQAIGFAPFPYQLTAYVIAGVIAGLAGVFLANQAEFVSPAYMSWQRSGELIVMVVLGGMGTLVGPIAGAVAFLLLEDWLAQISEHWKLGLGIFLVLLVLFTRGGIAGFVGRITGRGPQ